MKIQSNKPIILFFIVAISILSIVLGKIAYNKYVFSSDPDLRAQLIKKVSKVDKVSPEDIKIEKIDTYNEGKLTFVVVYYTANDGQQKSKTFKYFQAVFGRTVVGKRIQ